MGAGVKSARHWVWKRTGSVLMINFIYTNFLTGSEIVPNISDKTWYYKAGWSN